jgi:hypothetical protein
MSDIQGHAAMTWCVRANERYRAAILIYRGQRYGRRSSPLLHGTERTRRDVWQAELFG